MNTSDQENINSIIGVDPVDIAQLHLFHRSSVIGRRELGKELVSTIKPLKDFKISPDFKNRNVEILQAYLKSMGLKLEFLGETYDIPIKSDRLESYTTDEGLFIGTVGEYDDYMLMQQIKKKYQDDICLVGTNEEIESILNKEFEDARDRRDCYTIDID